MFSFILEARAVTVTSSVFCSTKHVFISISSGSENSSKRTQRMAFSAAIVATLASSEQCSTHFRFSLISCMFAVSCLWFKVMCRCFTGTFLYPFRRDTSTGTSVRPSKLATKVHHPSKFWELYQCFYNYYYCYYVHTLEVIVQSIFFCVWLINWVNDWI